MQLFIALVIVLCFSLFVYIEDSNLEITKFEINSNIKGEIKIIQLSDLHSKEYGYNNVVLLDKIAAIKPDMIVVTGDMVDEDAKKIDDVINFLKKLCTAFPVVFVAGNHEHRTGRFEEIMNKLKENSVFVLENEIYTQTVKDNKVNILGLDENQGSKDDYEAINKGKYDYKDNKVYFNELSKKEGFKIVLSHYPENFALIGDKSYNQFDFDVMFSGHSHGGQWRLPFIGGVIAPGQGFFPKYYQGIYGDKPTLIVSRGLGNSAFPFRIFNNPEIVIIEIN